MRRLILLVGLELPARLTAPILAGHGTVLNCSAAVERNAPTT